MKKSILIVSVLALCLSVDVTKASSIRAITDTTVEGELRVWHPMALSFPGPSASEMDNDPNPFLNYRLQVTFTGPGSQVYYVPGFFDRDGSGAGTGDVWRVRFTPDEAGTWRYLVSFRQGPNVAISLNADAGNPTAFNGIGGMFEVAAHDQNASGFLGKGRLVHEEGSFYLKTLGDGKYWIKGGTDSPENFLAYKGFDNTPDKHDYDNHVADWHPGDPDWGNGKGKGIIGALNYLASQHVNSIYLLLMNIGGDGRDVWPYAGTINRNGGAGVNENLHFDISKLTQWEIVFAHAQRKGIHLHFVLNEGERNNKTELDNAKLGVERKLYYREMIARFGHHNAIMWNLCEEYDIKGLSISPSMIKSWAQYIRDVDPYDHPITVHNAGKDAWVPFFGDNRFNAISYQYYGVYGDTVESLRAQADNARRPIAINIDEPFRVGKTDDMSHQTEWPMLSGQSYIRTVVLWPVLLSGGSVEWILEGLLEIDDFRAYENMWKYTWYARKFMEENLPFWQMQPADHLLTDEPRGGLEDGQVFAKQGQVYAIYLPSGGNGKIDLTEALGRFVQRWYNPRTGSFEGQSSLLNGGGATAFTAPGSGPYQDWVLYISR